MGERLIIDNFAGIKHIELELTRINILIGPQATGKSICAKLLYLFKGFIFELLNAIEDKSKPQLDRSFINKFKEYFPPETWHIGDFSIRYEIEGEFIEITKKGIKPKLYYSDLYYTEFRKGKQELKKSNIENEREGRADRWRNVHNIRGARLSEFSAGINELSTFKQVFIPAGRSFFAILQNSIFTFLSTNGAVDPVMTEFGRFYESVKHYPLRRYREREEYKELIDKKVEFILRGKRINIKGKDYLQLFDGRNVDLPHASSGQQEMLPLAVILSFFPFYHPNSNGHSIYIEEPEAHLFPTSQRAIVELLAMVFTISKQPQLQYFITTHSPYILTSLNNLMQAGYLSKVLLESKLNELYKIVPKEQIIDPDCVSAYFLKDGKAKNISCEDTGLINACTIDEVSDELSIQFGDLLEME